MYSVPGVKLLTIYLLVLFEWIIKSTEVKSLNILHLISIELKKLVFASGFDHWSWIDVSFRLIDSMFWTGSGP